MKTGSENGASAGGEVADARSAHDLSARENAVLCRGCVRCCSYISIEIDAPRAAWEYDQWIWALHHRGIGIYLERPERWYLHIDTVCRQLDVHGRCSIYGEHPVLCRDYDPLSCERRLHLSHVRAWFRAADELESWLRVNRPGHWRRLEAYRRDRSAGPPLADTPVGATFTTGLVTVQGLRGR